VQLYIILVDNEVCLLPFSPPDSLPPDSLPPDSLSSDSLPPDSLPPDSLPPDSLPPESLPPDSLPPDSLPPDSLPPNYLPAVYLCRVTEVLLYLLLPEADFSNPLLHVLLTDVCAWQVLTSLLQTIIEPDNFNKAVLSIVREGGRGGAGGEDGVGLFSFLCLLASLNAWFTAGLKLVACESTVNYFSPEDCFIT